MKCLVTGGARPNPEIFLPEYSQYLAHRALPWYLYWMVTQSRVAHVSSLLLILDGNLEQGCARIKLVTYIRF